MLPGVRRIEVRKRSVAARVALLVGVFGAALAPSACTFYTGCPDQPANPGAGNESSGGANANGGKAGGGGGKNGVSGSNAGGEGGGAAEQPGQWEDAVGSLTGRSAGCGVVFLAQHPAQDELLIGIDQFGVWSNTEGDEWVGLGTSGTSAVIRNGVNALVFDPEDPKVFWEAGIYTGPGGYRTDDGGKTFVQLGTLTHVDHLAVDFTDPERKTLIAGPHEKSTIIYKSVDGGETWADITNLPEGFGFSNSVAILNADTYLVGVTNGIIRTTDGGDSWEIVSQLGGHMAPLFASDGSIYWNAEANQGMVRSTDEGQTWERIVGGGVLNTSRPPIELPGGRLASLQEQHVMISDDRGFSWNSFGEELPYVIKGFVYSPERKAFYASTDSCGEPIPGNAISKLPFDWETD